MADGRCIENRFLVISQQPIARFQWNFVWRSSFVYRISAVGQISTFHRMYFFVFLMQFGLRRAAAAFISSPIHLF